MAKQRKMSVKIKKQFESTIVAFGNSGLPLGKRNDILDLAIIAQQSQDPSLIQLFEELPPLADLQNQKIQPLLPVMTAITEAKNETSSKEE